MLGKGVLIGSQIFLRAISLAIAEVRGIQFLGVPAFFFPSYQYDLRNTFMEYL